MVSHRLMFREKFKENMDGLDDNFVREHFYSFSYLDFCFSAHFKELNCL